LNEEQDRRSVDWRDAVGLLGVALITAGAAMIFVPAGLIVCGALLLAGVILASRRA
jgi:hypothetical protein